MIKVCIGDRNEWKNTYEEFFKMRQWACKNCKSFYEMRTTEVSDISLYYNYVAEFSFTDDRDATLFRLMWS